MVNISVNLQKLSDLSSSKYRLRQYTYLIIFIIQYILYETETIRFSWGKIKENKNSIAERSSVQGNSLVTERIRDNITRAMTDFG